MTDEFATLLDPDFFFFVVVGNYSPLLALWSHCAAGKCHWQDFSDRSLSSLLKKKCDNHQNKTEKQKFLTWMRSQVPAVSETA